MPTELIALAGAQLIWPTMRLRTARKAHKCDACLRVIQPGDEYIDPGERNPENGGGFGGYRYCLICYGDCGPAQARREGR